MMTIDIGDEISLLRVSPGLGEQLTMLGTGWCFILERGCSMHLLKASCAAHINAKNEDGDLDFAASMAII